MNDARGATTASGQFDALLERLRADGSEAMGYEALRRRLIQFFRLHVPAEAEDLADVVLDRLARKIHEGTEVASVPSYTLGIARMVLHESHARSVRRRGAEDDPTFAPDDDDEAARAETEATLAALSACLDAAGGESRGMAIVYYGADGAARIAARQRLAAERGISLNALRNRALRLREALEDCVRSRMGWSEAP